MLSTVGHQSIAVICLRTNPLSFTAPSKLFQRTPLHTLTLRLILNSFYRNQFFVHLASFYFKHSEGKSEHVKRFWGVPPLMILRFLRPLRFSKQFIALSVSQTWSF